MIFQFPWFHLHSASWDWIMAGTVAAAFNSSAYLTNTFSIAVCVKLELVCSYKLAIVRDVYGVLWGWEGASQLWLDKKRR